MKVLEKFDLHALVAPKSAQDVLAMLREIRSEVANVSAHLDAIAEKGEAQQKEHA